MYKIIKRIIDRTFKVHSPSKWLKKGNFKIKKE
nr:MAG TPA: hypothetical protein [Caudoviricetes sp.]